MSSTLFCYICVRNIKKAEKGEFSSKFKDFDMYFASCWFRSLTSMPLLSDVGRILTVCEYKRVDEEEGDGGKLEVGKAFYLRMRILSIKTESKCHIFR